MAAKCHMDLDAQKLSLAYPRGHFDTFLTCGAQSDQKLQHVEIWSKIHTSRIESFRLGSIIFDMYGSNRHENFTIYPTIIYDNQKVCTCWGWTRNGDELARFESSVFLRLSRPHRTVYGCCSKSKE